MPEEPVPLEHLLKRSKELRTDEDSTERSGPKE